MAADENTEAVIGTVSYAAVVTEGLSADNTLSGLTVSNASLCPAFSADITSYTAKVPFSVHKLELQAAAASERASLEFKNPDLMPNAVTNVVVTVTAEDGSQKMYVISVSREAERQEEQTQSTDAPVTEPPEKEP